MTYTLPVFFSTQQPKLPAAESNEDHQKLSIMVTRAVIANPNVADMIEKEVGCEKNYTESHGYYVG